MRSALARTTAHTAPDPAPPTAFPPPAEALSLYAGPVMHARLKPVGHRFSYRVLALLIDLDRLDEAGRASRLFGVNRAAPVSFHERDHGPRDGTPLAAWAREALRDAGVEDAGGRLMLLCFPRVAGFGFTPLSVYFAFRADGGLAGVIYEVRNTFGGIHHYVCPVRPGEIGPAGLRQDQAKDFYVSPFIPMAMRYHFRILPPGPDAVRLRILETDADGPLLAASFSGRRVPATSWALAFSLISLPLMPLKVMGGIHFEALRLWLKGARIVPRDPPQAARGDEAPWIDQARAVPGPAKGHGDG